MLARSAWLVHRSESPCREEISRASWHHTGRKVIFVGFELLSLPFSPWMEMALNRLYLPWISMIRQLPQGHQTDVALSKLLKLYGADEARLQTRAQPLSRKSCLNYAVAACWSHQTPWNPGVHLISWPTGPGWRSGTWANQCFGTQGASGALLNPNLIQALPWPIDHLGL